MSAYDLPDALEYAVRLRGRVGVTERVSVLLAVELEHYVTPVGSTEIPSDARRGVAGVSVSF